MRDVDGIKIKTETCGRGEKREGNETEQRERTKKQESDEKQESDKTRRRRK